jgi:3-oxoadipate enol-lactonase
MLDIRTIGPLGPQRTRYARNGTLRIAYELQGTMHRRRSWLVLIQGMGFDRSGWDPVLRMLRRRFRLVLVDNRGTGRSDRPDGKFTVADMADDVVAVLDAARIGRAHVLGASLGGMVAQELAISHPERVGSLVLACTAPGWPLAYPMPAASIWLITSTRRIPVEAARRRYIENALSAPTVKRNPDLVERLMDMQGARPADRKVLSAQAKAGARYAGQLGQRRIRARTLVLHGGADTVVDPRNGELLARRIAGARLVTFPGLGHLLFWEDPGGFAAAVTSFLLDPDGTGTDGDLPGRRRPGRQGEPGHGVAWQPGSWLARSSRSLSRAIGSRSRAVIRTARGSQPTLARCSRSRSDARVNWPAAAALTTSM